MTRHAQVDAEDAPIGGVYSPRTLTIVVGLSLACQSPRRFAGSFETSKRRPVVGTFSRIFFAIASPICW